MLGCMAPFEASGATLVLGRSSSSYKQDPESGRSVAPWHRAERHPLALPSKCFNHSPRQ